MTGYVRPDCTKAELVLLVEQRAPVNRVALKLLQDSKRPWLRWEAESRIQVTRIDRAGHASQSLGLGDVSCARV